MARIKRSISAISPILERGGRCYTEKTLDQMRRSKIKGRPLLYILSSILEGRSYQTIATALNKPPYRLHDITLRKVRRAVEVNYPILQEMSIRQLRATLHKGLATKSARIQSLIRQVDQLSEIISSFRNTRTHKWLVHPILPPLFSERRRTLAALQAEVDPIMNPAIQQHIVIGSVDHTYTHIVQKQEEADTIGEVLSVTDAEEIPQEAKEGLARALAALAAPQSPSPGASD